MMNTHQSILSELEKLETKPPIDKKILQKFYSRLKDQKILRTQNTSDHFCVFFVPYDKREQLIYLGHHIKANDSKTSFARGGLAKLNFSFLQKMPH